MNLLFSFLVLSISGFDIKHFSHKMSLTAFPLLWCVHLSYEISIPLRLYKVKVAQSCLTLCNSMDCSLPGSSVHGIFQARILVSHSLLQIFPTQGLNPGLWYCRQIPYHLSHQGSLDCISSLIKYQWQFLLGITLFSALHNFLDGLIDF